MERAESEGEQESKELVVNQERSSEGFGRTRSESGEQSPHSKESRVQQLGGSSLAIWAVRGAGLNARETRRPPG